MFIVGEKSNYFQSKPITFVYSLDTQEFITPWEVHKLGLYLHIKPGELRSAAIIFAKDDEIFSFEMGDCH